MRTPSCRLALLSVFLSIPVLSGCGSTEAMRKSLHYDGEALEAVDEKLEFIENNPDATPSIADTAKAARTEVANVRASIPLLKSEIGEPDLATTPPYTPEEHAKTNEQAKKELENKAGMIDTAWNFVQTGAGKLTLAIFGTTIGAMVVGWLRTKIWSGKLWEYAKIAGSMIGKTQARKDEFAAKAVSRGVTNETFKVVEALPPITPAPPVAVVPTPAIDKEPVVVVEPAKP